MSREYTPPLENITGREEEGLPQGRTIFLSIHCRKFFFREIFPKSNIWNFGEVAGNIVHGTALPLKEALDEAESLVKRLYMDRVEEAFKSLRKTRAVSRILKKFQS